MVTLGQSTITSWPWKFPTLSASYARDLQQGKPCRRRRRWNACIDLGVETRVKLVKPMGYKVRPNKPKPLSPLRKYHCWLFQDGRWMGTSFNLQKKAWCTADVPVDGSWWPWPHFVKTRSQSQRQPRAHCAPMVAQSGWALYLYLMEKNPKWIAVPELWLTSELAHKAS